MKIECKNVFFKNEEIYKKSKNSFYIRAYFHPDKVIVEIDDLGKASWQLPLKVISIGSFDNQYNVENLNITTKDVGNPKIREYTHEEFNKHYYIPNKNETII